jgi:predicted transcriptional regulator
MRTTIYLDEDLNVRLRRLVPHRGLNRFINEAVAEKVEALERQRIEKEMMEGYLAASVDREELARDWEVIDLEGWPE